MLVLSMRFQKDSLLLLYFLHMQREISSCPSLGDNIPHRFTDFALKHDLQFSSAVSIVWGAHLADSPSQVSPEHRRRSSLLVFQLHLLLFVHAFCDLSADVNIDKVVTGGEMHASEQISKTSVVMLIPTLQVFPMINSIHVEVV